MATVSTPQASDSTLQIGWGQADLTPAEAVLLAGQFHVRVSEGVLDPISCTALALESSHNGQPADHAVMISCDLLAISDLLRKQVRVRLAGLTGLDPRKVVFHATHTHSAPETRAAGFPGACQYAKELNVMSAEKYVEWAAEQIAGAVRQAWTTRQPGGFAFALGQAVVGHNRRWTNLQGLSQMYGNTNDPAFSHIEGYEDHAVNLLFTYDTQRRLTGLVVNLACPSQVSENEFRISADFWHDTRQEIRRRHGTDLFVLGQCSAAGDQSPRHIIRKAAEERMLMLKRLTQRQEIARRIAAAVDEVAPHLNESIDWRPLLAHHCQMLSLPRRNLSEREVQASQREAAPVRARYETLRQELARDPGKRLEPRWYLELTRTDRYAAWLEAVAQRCAEQTTKACQEVELHAIRLGEVAFACNPFEYYLDFGTRIAARSPATQTFVVQLAGAGTYVPSLRAAEAGGYGAVPASTLYGADAGQLLADETIKIIQRMWGAS